MDHTALLKNTLQGTGFVRRGSAFFRVWGDGVLQVLKFQRQRSYHVHDLSVGIFSMYGKLRPEWFTSGGCIPRGSSAYFVGLHFADGHLPPSRFTETENGQFLYEGFPVSVDPNQRLRDQNGESWKYCFTPEQQINILTERVLPWLNDMTSQSSAAKAMYEIWPVPNDGLRFDAHLAAGEWTEAEQTMSAILKQHADARAGWKQSFPSDKYTEMVAQQEARDEPLIAAFKMVREKNEQAIFSYLRDNYKRNCALAKFCIK
ncbi:MAG: hypothetical protein IJE08_13505 [Clostridia bacterium]|nr:hypothetical protein [Clostridia bacterium]